MRGLAAFVLASTVALGGCYSCTMMLAPGGATVHLVADAWPAGDYTVEMLGETCDFTLPAPDVTHGCEQLGLAYTDDRTGLADVWIMMSDPPPTFEVALSLDGVEFQRSEVAPVYEIEEPNGPHCGEASYGDATLAVETP